MAEEQKTRLSVVIEPDGFDHHRGSLSALEAFHLNANPLELLARYEPEEWASVLLEIERHQHELEAQQTPAQAEWAGARVHRNYVSTGRAAELIVRAL